MLKLDVHRGIARVTLNRPDVHNALNDELIAHLRETFIDLGSRNDVRVIVLAGEGKSFCAGADLNWMSRVANYSYEENLKDAMGLANAFLAIAKCPKPVIARVHGAALGGGAGLVTACDIGIAVESTQFGFTEVKLGIIPAVISPFVIARIGAARCREFFLTGERFLAVAAHSIGLIQHVVINESALDALVESKAAQIFTSSPAAVAAAKELIFGVAERTLQTSVEFTAEAIARARASAEGKAGMNAFLSRTKPPWIQS
jgi:methylglutaconyl-CoA hydratase